MCKTVCGFSETLCMPTELQFHTHTHDNKALANRISLTKRSQQNLQTENIATVHHRYCLSGIWYLYIGRPSVIKPLNNGGLSRLNSVKPSVRYISTVARWLLLRVVQMTCEPHTFNVATTQASARLAMLTSPTVVSFHWLSMSIRRMDWQWSAGMWEAFGGEWKLEMMSCNSISHITNSEYNNIHILGETQLICEITNALCKLSI